MYEKSEDLLSRKAFLSLSVCCLERAYAGMDTTVPSVPSAFLLALHIFLPSAPHLFRKVTRTSWLVRHRELV